jgi:ABC-type nitrate/sulfonate/bicarbonate transport system substrate-binding protein
VTIAIPNAGTGATFLLVAQSQHLFAKYGLAAKITVMKPNIALAALDKGQIDFLSAVGSSIRGAMRGLPVRVVFVGLDAPPQVLIGAKTITSVSQLKGRTLALKAPGNTVNLVAEQLLRQAGLTPAMYKVDNAGTTPAEVALLEKGLAQATLLDTVTAARVVDKGYHLLETAQNLPMPYVGLATSLDMVKQHPKMVSRVLEAALAAVKLCATDEGAVSAVATSRFHLTSAQAGRVFDELKASWTSAGQPSQAAVKFELRLDSTALKLAKEPSPAQIFDFAPVQRLSGTIA